MSDTPLKPLADLEQINDEAMLSHENVIYVQNNYNLENGIIELEAASRTFESTIEKNRKAFEGTKRQLIHIREWATAIQKNYQNNLEGFVSKEKELQDTLQKMDHERMSWVEKANAALRKVSTLSDELQGTRSLLEIEIKSRGEKDNLIQKREKQLEEMTRAYEGAKNQLNELNQRYTLTLDQTEKQAHLIYQELQGEKELRRTEQYKHQTAIETVRNELTLANKQQVKRSEIEKEQLRMHIMQLQANISDKNISQLREKIQSLTQELHTERQQRCTLQVKAGKLDEASRLVAAERENSQALLRKIDELTNEKKSIATHLKNKEDEVEKLNHLHFALLAEMNDEKYIPSYPADEVLERESFTMPEETDTAAHTLVHSQILKSKIHEEMINEASSPEPQVMASDLKAVTAS